MRRCGDSPADSPSGRQRVIRCKARSSKTTKPSSHRNSRYFHSLVKNETSAADLTNLLGISLAALGGAWWSLEVVTELMSTVGHISPVAWAMDGYTSLFFENGDLGAEDPDLAGHRGGFLYPWCSTIPL